MYSAACGAKYSSGTSFELPIPKRPASACFKQYAYFVHQSSQVKDELIRAMKESNSSMRLDSLVLMRQGCFGTGGA